MVISRIAFLRSLLVATALLGSVGAHADEIFFSDGRENVDRGNVTADTLRRVEWRGPGNISGNASPWLVQRYRLDRSRGADSKSFETIWSDAMRNGFNDSNHKSIREAVTEALKVAKPAAYPDTDGPELRLRFYLIRAMVNLDEDPTEEYAKFVDMNKAMARTIARTVTGSGRRITGGPYKDIDYAHVHSFTIESLVEIGHWWIKKGDMEKAWEEGYGPAVDLAEGAKAVFTLDEYVTKYAVPILKDAALAFQRGATPNYKRAAETYTRIATIAARPPRDEGLVGWARLMAARCSLNEGDTLSAERVYNDILKPFEDSQRAGRPGDQRFDWLTSEKATNYAQALNGRALIAIKAGEDTAALRHLSQSLAFFSADREARAEALWEAARANVRIGTKNERAREYYRKTADAYYNELAFTLADTSFGRRVGELRDAIRGMEKK